MSFGQTASQEVDLDGPVHFVDHGGSGPVIVCVHGLGGSLVNWSDLAPRLTAAGRVFTLDLVGHGLTRRDGRSAAVLSNMALVSRFIDEVAGGPAIVVGNSMGGMIALHLAAARSGQVAGLVLIDPSVPGLRAGRPDFTVLRTFALYAVPALGERFLARRRSRLGAERLVAETLALCCVDPTRVSAELRAASVALVQARADVPDIDAAFLEAARSLLRILARPDRYLAMIGSIDQPTLVLQGEQDRLVPAAAVRSVVARKPEWTLRLLPDIGHTPQMEAPERTAQLILDWLAGTGQAAVTAAARH